MQLEKLSTLNLGNSYDSTLNITLEIINQEKDNFTLQKSKQHYFIQSIKVNIDY